MDEETPALPSLPRGRDSAGAERQSWLHVEWQQTATPPTPGQFVPAGFGVRLLAVVIDLTALALLLAGLVLLTVLLGYDVEDGDTLGPVLALALFLAYSPLLSAVCGATPGKRLCGLRVMRLLTGEPASWGRVLLRHVVHGLMIIPLLFLLTHLWPLWDKPYRQTLHDKWSHTVVVRQFRARRAV